MEENIPTDLIIRYLSNEATTEESEKLLDWVADDSANQKVFAEWTKAWNYQFPYHSPFDVSKGLIDVNKRIDAYESSKKLGSPFSWAKIAVITLAVSVVGAMTFSVYNGDTTDIQYSEFRVSAGIDSVNLPDGSKVVLKANSAIKYPSNFTSNIREISLEGEAFFKVKRDITRPFLVKTKNLTTEVLGTSFNIQSGPHHSIVTVATGKVKVSDGNDNFVLQEREKVTYSIASKKMLKASSNLSELEWISPPLHFKDVPLSVIARRMEDYYGVTIVFETEALTDCTLTGKFSNESIDNVLNAICFSIGAKVRKEGDRFVLSGPGCAE